MSGWEAAYGLLVVQVTLLSLMAAGAYLVPARRHPAAAKRFLGVTILLILGLTLVAGLPLPGFWSLGIWPKEVAATQPLKPPSLTQAAIDQETETLASLPGLSWTNVAELEDPAAAPIDVVSPLASSPENIEVPWTRVLALCLIAGGIIVGIRLKDLVAWLAWVPLDEDLREVAARQGVHLTLLRKGETIEATLHGEAFATLELPPGS